MHAGGIAWRGPWLHVAATARGLFICHVDDIVRVPDGRRRLAASTVPAGYRYLLPVRFAYEARTDDGHEQLRYSFLSLDRASTPAAARRRRVRARPADPAAGATTRSTRTRCCLAGDEDGASRPLRLDDGGVGHAQGAVLGRRPLLRDDVARPVDARLGVRRPARAHWRRHRWAVPMGPEDIAYWPSRDELWSQTEHPRRRWVFSMRRSRLARLTGSADRSGPRSGRRARTGRRSAPGRRRRPGRPGRAAPCTRRAPRGPWRPSPTTRATSAATSSVSMSRWTRAGVPSPMRCDVEQDRPDRADRR